MRFLTRKLSTADVNQLDRQMIEFDAGDQLIIECERRVTQREFDRLRSQLNERSSDKIILEAGLRLVGRRKNPEAS